MGLLCNYVDAMRTSTLFASTAKLATKLPTTHETKPWSPRPEPLRASLASTKITQSPSKRLADLKILKTLAPALFGEVLLCLDAKTGGHVAVKRVDLRCAHAHVTIGKAIRVVESLEQERAVHAKLVDAASTNLLVLEEEVHCHGHLYLIFPYCARGDLFDVVRNSPFDGRLTEALARPFLQDVVQGLLCLKRNGFAHRDISLENVLLDATGGCYVCDFGLAIHHGKRQVPGRVGKAWYMAPEVYAANEPYDALQADMWSLGVLLAIMLMGAPLVEKPACTDRRFCVLNQAGSVRGLYKLFPSELADVTWDLLDKLLRINPTERPTLEQVADHAFLACR
ncbi:hypothetical protein PsorP6_001791 [Peronosclerospora sorghi]|uniref:Uncharacterized protein n=1 Tax=Peronosclerospora sorghi TaxID=230839 RepID=A0ACC0WU77_9STRA|nr:hypothetical protein PsorP6_001791 [Peronosclerospora sorghi]